MDDHDLQREGLRYKWMIMICRDMPSGTNRWPFLQRQALKYKWMIMIFKDRTSVKSGWSWPAETEPQSQMDYHDLQRETLRYKWMIMICRHRPSVTNGLSWSAETGPQLQMDDHDLQGEFPVKTDDHVLYRHTLRYKQITIICRPSSTNWWSWSSETDLQA